MIVFSLLQGAAVLLVVLSVYVISLYRGQGELDARTLCFTTLIVANLGLILTNRSWSRSILSTFRLPNAALWWVLGGAALFLGTVLYLPFLKEIFRFDTLHATDLIICLSAGITSILWFEVFKVFRNKRLAA
jgi:Ca2+-transporting ATPase